jgi:hypothetical protein
MIKEEYRSLNVVQTPNVVERLCASVGGHIMNSVNMDSKQFHEGGLPKNFRVHVCFMAPSGWGKSFAFSMFLDPVYGLLSGSDIPVTVSTTFTQESWVGTVVRDEKCSVWEATDGVLVKYKRGIVGADEFARLKCMMESRGEEHDITYLLSALDKSYCEKQHSGKPITIRDIGMTFWCGLRPTRMNIADSGLARRFSFQTYYPTIQDAQCFKRAGRLAKHPISSGIKAKVAGKIHQLRGELKKVKAFDLSEVYAYVDGDPLIPHFEESIYTRIAIGFGIASDNFPKIRMSVELKALLDDEKLNRKHIKINPETEMVYRIVEGQDCRVSAELVAAFLGSNYQLSRSKVLHLISLLKQSGRVVESDGFLICREKINDNMIEVIKHGK